MSLRQDERGIAMIAVLLVLMVVSSLSIGVVQLANTNLQHSAADRRRDQALQAAQAAVDNVLAMMTTTRSNRVCTYSGTTGTLSVTPSITYSARVTAIDTSGNIYTCPTAPPSGSVLSKLVVTGTGTTGGAGPAVTRKWQSLVNLKPIYGGLANAIFGDKGLCITNGPVIRHNTVSNDATIYTNGSFDDPAFCGGGTSSGNILLEGSIQAQGNIFVGGGCIDGDVWAGGDASVTTKYIGGCDDASVAANQPPAPVCAGGNHPCYFVGKGNITAAGLWAGSTGAVSLSSSTAYGTCKAKGTEGWSGGSTCSPNRDSISPWLPATCTGTVGNNTPNCGYSSQSGLTGPDPVPMPAFTYTASEWTTAPPDGPGYVEKIDADCATAKADIIAQGNVGAVNKVIRVNATCNIDFPTSGGGTTINLRANTVVVTNGSLTASQLTVNTNAGSCTGSADLYPNNRCLFAVIVPTAAANTATCLPPGSATTWDISFSQTTDLSGADTFIYTPCTANLTQLSDANGQVVTGRTVLGNNNTTNFVQIKIPGWIVSGYNVAPVYFRECKSDATTCP